MKKANLVLAAAMATAGVTGLVAGAIYPVPALAADKAPAQKVSPSLLKPLKAAQEALVAKNFDEALVQLQAAQAIEPKTPYDVFMIDELSWSTYLQKKDYPAAINALEQSMNSGFVAPADVPTRLKALTQLNYEQKNYAKAAEYGTKYLEASPSDSNMALMVAHAYYMDKNYTAAVALTQKEIARTSPPSEQMIQILLQSEISQKNNAGALQALETRVRYYPTKGNWSDLMKNTLSQVRGDNELRDYYRLMEQTDTLSTSDEYAEAASVLVSGGFPAEAVKVLGGGMAAGVFSGESLTRAKAELDRARAGAATDAKDLPNAAKGVAAAKTGKDAVAYGKLYFSSGDYTSAVDAIRKGLAMGGVTDTDDANALLAIALIRAGRPAEAKEPLQAVKAPSFATVVRLWQLYIDATSAPAPTTGG